MSSARCWLISACFFLCLASCASAGCDPPPLQEGRQGTLVCNAPITTKELLWQLERGGSFVNVSSCGSPGPCSNLLQDFSASSQATTNNTVYQSLLTIFSANRNDTTFKCIVDGGAAEIVCKTEIYVTPVAPTCSSPVAYSSNTIALSCNTARVYPEAMCAFYYLAQNLNTSFPVRVEYSNSPSPTSLGDTATVCTIVMEVTGFKPGNYQLSVKMFPKLQKVPTISVVTVNAVPTITLRAPTVALSQDCPTGPSVHNRSIDARFSEDTVCECNLDEAGFPRGQAVWYNNSGSIVGITNTADGSSNMTLLFNSNDPNPSYQCTARTVLNTTTASVRYQPLYAFGPNFVSISSDNKEFDLCPSTKKNLSISCLVPTSLVKPQPTFSIFINSQIRVSRQLGRLMYTGYSYSYSFRPQSVGELQVTCRAENSVFSDAQVENSVTIQVREPPTTAPKMAVISRGTDIYQKNVYVENGDSLSVTCVVDGGIPLVESVIVRCGDRSKNETGNRATLVLSASASLSGHMCYCQASHVTNCYSQVTQIVLNVQTLNNPDTSGGGTGNNLGIKVGLSVSLSVVALAFIVTLVIVLFRHRSRRAPSQPPTYVSDWINNKPYDHVTSFSGSLSGQSLHVTPPPYAPPERPDSHIYDEPQPPDYTETHVHAHRNAPIGHRNARFSDYIQPT